MKFFLNFFLIVAFGLYEINALKSDNFCVNLQKTCTGYYDSKDDYKLKCERVKCRGNFNVSCHKDFCSSDSASCNRLINVYFLIKSLSSSYLYDSKMKKFTSFVDSILKCPFVKYKFNSNDFCANAKSCFLSESLLIRNENRVHLKSIACPCQKAHSVHCDGYCAISDEACKMLKKQNKTRLIEIKNCSKKNLIFSKKIRIF